MDQKPTSLSQSEITSARCLIRAWTRKTPEDINNKWGCATLLKGIMSVADAKRAVDVGATAIVVSNHGGRQLDGSQLL